MSTDTPKADAREYVIVRTERAGAFAGFVSSADSLAERMITLTKARRLWRWSGAATLSELAVRGTSKPNECRFPAPMRTILLPQVIEVIWATDEARVSITSVPVWSA
jgi:hypothetical protein